MTATTLPKDPAPGITPSPAVEIRTDVWNDMVDILNGVSSEFTNLTHQLVSKTGSYIATIDDFCVLGDATGGAFSITLPSAAAAGAVKKIMAFKKIDSSANAVTIDGDGAETIDGKTTIPLLTQDEILIIQSDGTNWVIIASYLATVDNGLFKMFNPAGTFTLTQKVAAIAANRSATTPLLIADDNYVMELHIQDMTNKGIDISRILGLPSTQISIATGALPATAALISVDAEGAPTTDTLDTITGLSDGDIVGLVAKASNVITVTHDVGGADSIHLTDKIDIELSEKVPLFLIREGGEFYQFAGPEITKIELALGKPADALATGDNQVTFVMDKKGKLLKAKAYVDTVSSSGLPTFQLVESSGGVDILSTLLTINVSEKTSETAAAPVVIKSDGTEILIADERVRVDVDIAGTGTLGAILTLWFLNLSDE